MLITTLFALLWVTLSAQASISTDLLERISLYNQYCAAVYCTANTDLIGPPNRTLACKTGNCPLVEKQKAYLYSSMYEPVFSSLAMVTIDPTAKKIVLVFRGGQLLGLAAAPVEIFMLCPVICPTCLCATGPYLSWITIRPQIVWNVQNAMKQYPGWPLVVTGYSLGAAQAQYAAAEFRSNNTGTVEMYNFGQMRLGDATFANFVTAQGSNYRVTHTDDPIPRDGLPELGFRHVSPEYWIYRDAGIAGNYSVNATDFKVLVGTLNLTGVGAGTGKDAVAHATYLQPQMSICLGNFTIGDGLTTIRKKRTLAKEIGL